MLLLFKFYVTASFTQRSKTLVISHGGASGDYPDCAMLAYVEGAVKGGADFIDCPVQITQDGVPICRGSIDLLSNTDITTSNSDLVANRTSTFPQLSNSSGVYTFNLTWSEIQTLKAITDNSELKDYPVNLNKEYDGQQNILNFTEFLNYAKTQSVNILVDIQYGYILETEIGVDVVTLVLSALSDAGLENSSRVVIQSEDSAILKRVSETNNYTLAFRVTETNITIAEAVVSEIKALATYATVERGLIQPRFDSYLQKNSTGVVDLFHDANMSVFVHYLRNVFTFLPYDYESDPTAEIDTMVQYFKVDGIITTFPATAKAYLGNGCLNLKTEIGGLEYQPAKTLPGAYLTQVLMQAIPGYYKPPAPWPLLDVDKNQTMLPLSVNSTLSSSTSPSPSSPTDRNNAATTAHLHGSARTSLFIASIIAFQHLVCCPPSPWSNDSDDSGASNQKISSKWR